MTSKFSTGYSIRLMRYVTLLLILALILCSMGFDDEANHSYNLSDIINHKNHEHESSGIGSILNSHKNTQAADHENATCICDLALLNASNNHYFNVKKNFLYSAAVDITTLEIGKILSFSVSPQIKAVYTPPDVFLSNSSFLL